MLRISGSKNASTGILVASLLSDSPVLLKNVSRTRDIGYIIRVMRQLNQEVIYENNILHIRPKKPFRDLTNYDLFSYSRSCLYFIPLLNLDFLHSQIGGCSIGNRPTTTFFSVLKQISKGETEIIFEEMSVCATKAALIKIAKIKKEFKLLGVAAEPCVQNLCQFLQILGVTITGVGTHHLTVMGNSELSFNQEKPFQIIYDKTEAFTWLALTALIKSDSLIGNVPVKYMKRELHLLKQLGYQLEITDNYIRINSCDSQTIDQIHNMPWPGISPDILPLLTPLLMQGKGKTMVHDWMYNQRLDYLQQLIKLGANIKIFDCHRCQIEKTTDLSPGTLKCENIRSSACFMIISAIYSNIRLKNIRQLERGYWGFNTNLALLGLKSITPHYHLIGISGCGMKALAYLLIKKGYKVTGSDLKPNILPCHTDLHQKGFYITENTIVVYSSAISKKNYEMTKAKALKCKLQHRTEVLVDILSDYFQIAVVGSHGKTTTSSMIRHLLKLKYDVSWMIGSELYNLKSGHLGKDKIIVLELDESDGSFLNFHPDIGVITNIDTDHLEFYGSMDKMKASYEQFAKQCKVQVVYNSDYITLENQIPFCENNMQIYYSDYFTKFKYQGTIYSINTFGRHNALNALAAIICCQYFDTPIDFTKYKLPKQRMQFLYHKFGKTIIQDYAHHPTEIKEVVLALRNAKHQNIIGYYVPHRISRINKLWQEFKNIGQYFNTLYILPIDKVNHKGKFDLKKFAKHLKATPVKKVPELMWQTPVTHLFLGVNLKINIENFRLSFPKNNHKTI